MTDKNTFYNMLKSNAESQPDAVAVVYDTMKVTYAKLFDDVTKKALHFQKSTSASSFPATIVPNILTIHLYEAGPNIAILFPSNF